MSLYDKDDPNAQRYAEYWRGVANRVRIKGIAAMGYRNNGKQVLHIDASPAATQTHIADAGDNEKAHFLAVAANAYNEGDRYVSQAMVTCSAEFHGANVGRSAFTTAVNDAIKALTRLDMVKKSLFYGRDNNLIASGERGVSDLPNTVSGGIGGSLTLAQAAQYIHGVLGLATEAGEMLEGLRNAINGHGVDGVNVKEESGDAKWYLAILAHTFGYGWREDEAVNIAKLRERFGDQFTAYDANNRDLIAERAILEGPADELHLPPSHRSKRMDGERFQDGDAIEGQRFAAAADENNSSAT